MADMPPPPPPPSGPIIEHLGYAGRFAEAVGCYRIRPSAVDIVISPCEDALEVLEEAAELLQEAAEEVDNLYAVLLEVVDDPFVVLGPAASIVDCLLGAPGPLAGAIDAAANLIVDSFCYPPPEGVPRPLTDARRCLGSLSRVVRANNTYILILFCNTSGANQLPYFRWHYLHERTDAQVVEAKRRLDLAAAESQGAGLAIRQARSEGQSPRTSAVDLILQRAMREVNAVPSVMEAMAEVLEELELVEHKALISRSA